MKFLRLMPGKGEVVLAEGDPQLSEDEERLSRSSAASSTRACGPRCRSTDGSTGRREAIMVQRLRRDPAGRRAGDLLPARRGRLSRRSPCRRSRSSSWRWWRSRSAATSRRGEIRARRVTPAPRAGPSGRRSSASTRAPSAAPSDGACAAALDREPRGVGDVPRPRLHPGDRRATRSTSPGDRRLLLPDLPAQADRRLPAGLEQPAERVLRRVSRPQRARCTGRSCRTPTTCWRSG